MSRFTWSALAVFVGLLVLRALLRWKVPAFRSSDTGNPIPSSILWGVLILAGALGAGLAIVRVERWERIALAFGITAGVALFGIRIWQYQKARRQD